MLTRFIQAQQAEVARLAALEKATLFPAPFAGSRPSLAAHLVRKKPIALIAEYKRASPSLGDINLVATPEQVAAAYAGAGAAAISVLTEKAHFKGDIAFIERMFFSGLPLLRKDFLIHPLQVRETAAGPAAALLLIARILDEENFVRMLRAVAENGLETVLEVFDAPDLDKTRRALAKCPLPSVIIQVNNRDLQSLRVSEAPSRQLIRYKKDKEIWISASGITSQAQVEERSRLGYDAVLVGSYLMGQDAPDAALATLNRRGGDHESDSPV